MNGGQGDIIIQSRNVSFKMVVGNIKNINYMLSISSTAQILGKIGLPGSLRSVWSPVSGKLYVHSRAESVAALAKFTNLLSHLAR